MTARIRVSLVVLAAAGLLAGCREVATPTATPTAQTPGEIPSPVVTEQGGTYWGVYLAVGEEPDLEDAIRYLTEERGLEVGLEFSVGDLACDRGAGEALGGSAGPQRVAVYFDTEEDARAWAETLPASPVGLAEVQTFCID